MSNLLRYDLDAFIPPPDLILTGLMAEQIGMLPAGCQPDTQTVDALRFKASRERKKIMTNTAANIDNLARMFQLIAYNYRAIPNLVATFGSITLSGPITYSMLEYIRSELFTYVGISDRRDVSVLTKQRLTVNNIPPTNTALQGSVTRQMRSPNLDGLRYIAKMHNVSLKLYVDIFYS